MYAVIKTGGKQYRVAPQDTITVERLKGEAGDIIELDQVLMVAGEGSVEIGHPLVDGATVAAELVEQKRGKKIIVFKKKRRKGYRRTRGHRQYETVVRVSEILAKGARPAAAKAAAKPAAKKAEAKPAAKTSAAKKTAAKPAAKKAAAKPAARKTAAKPAAKKPAAAKKTAAKKAASAKKD